MVTVKLLISSLCGFCGNMPLGLLLVCLSGARSQRSGSARLPVGSKRPTSIINSGSISPFNTLCCVAPGLMATSFSLSVLICSGVAKSVLVISNTSATAACLRASACCSICCKPYTASMVTTTASKRYTDSITDSFIKLAIIGPGSAMPVVSITKRLNGGMALAANLKNKSRMVSASSLLKVQHKQPFCKSTALSAT